MEQAATYVVNEDHHRSEAFERRPVGVEQNCELLLRTFSESRIGLVVACVAWRWIWNIGIRWEELPQQVARNGLSQESSNH
jgi:hypothetical protein